ncbi:DUF1627 domain-containing protein [Escherichia coli]|uniref:DUF1627 domain-containing protein n=1 Tax=Escherichia coli TaxID=562 RepID=UPI0010ECC389|nr:DUF1627 domain-containing protein [Escherichia coli]EJF8031381.1 DUF1627 domain-containing protein [Escherichia coli]MDF1396567.1 DUF1627 domain-containing protein [Escherichia coli]GDF32108.1 hypothetical protein HmCmsJML270_00770 [Escherichia coli]HAL6342322.1 DUF1627 domain-containing protein [Escherichia coli]HAX4872297.1 DUF1627 domain-containing protein [Escherichia coli]
METVLDALKAMGKASYREIAARLVIEPVEALNMLREQREQGNCDFEDGGWSLRAPVKIVRKPEIKPTEPLRGEQPTPVGPGDITALLAERGALTAREVAVVFNRNARGMVSCLVSLAKRGLIQKNGQGDGVTWSLPVTETPPAAEPATTETAVPEVAQAEATPAPEKTVAELVDDIPTFVGRPDDLLIPTVRSISNEIRRTKSKLAVLENLRDSVRTIRRYQHIAREIAQ